MTTFQSPFNGKNTTDEILADLDLSGRNYVVTGGTSGIGRETVRALAAAGANVLFTVRSLDRSANVAEQIIGETNNQNIAVAGLDLTSVEQVEAFAQQVLEEYSSLDGLILNAGAMIPELHRNCQGIEAQFMTHYAGHLVIATALAPLLIAAAPSRIVSLTSSGHKICPPDLGDINFKNRPYSGFASYGQSKSAAALLAVELNRRLAGRGVLSFAVHPGVILDTELARDVGGKADEAARVKEHNLDPDKLKSVEQGAATTVWAATSAQLSETGGGCYLEDCQVSTPSESTDINAPGVMPYALDPETAQKLWKLTEAMLAAEFTP